MTLIINLSTKFSTPQIRNSSHLNAETFFKKPETFFRKRRNIFLKARGLFRRPQKASAGWSGNVRSLRPNRPHDEPQ